LRALESGGNSAALAAAIEWTIRAIEQIHDSRRNAWSEPVYR
jgi:hypothetical protein